MANPLMGILSNFAGGNNIMMQAAGAFLRGESPKDFLMNLAKTNPALQGLDLNDINGTAHRLCQERGIDEAKLTTEIRQTVAGMK